MFKKKILPNTKREDCIEENCKGRNRDLLQIITNKSIDTYMKIYFLF